MDEGMFSILIIHDYKPRKHSQSIFSACFVHLGTMSGVSLPCKTKVLF